MKTIFSIKGWIGIPRVSDLTRSITEEAHSLRYFIHLGATNICHDPKHHFDDVG